MTANLGVDGNLLYCGAMVAGVDDVKKDSQADRLLWINVRRSTVGNFVIVRACKHDIEDHLFRRLLLCADERARSISQRPGKRRQFEFSRANDA
jgi:hypothetical protein